MYYTDPAQHLNNGRLGSRYILYRSCTTSHNGRLGSRYVLYRSYTASNNGRPGSRRSRSWSIWSVCLTYGNQIISCKTSHNGRLGSRYASRYVLHRSCTSHNGRLGSTWSRSWSIWSVCLTCGNQIISCRTHHNGRSGSGWSRSRSISSVRRAPSKGVRAECSGLKPSSLVSSKSRQHSRENWRAFVTRRGESSVSRHLPVLPPCSGGG